MNSVKLHDPKSTYKNVLQFNALKMYYQRQKLRKQSHYSCIRRIKYLVINLIKVKYLSLKTTRH